MSKNIRPRVRIPKSVNKGQTFEVKAVVSHPMETGLRPDKETGKKIPRDIIHTFIATYNGAEVMNATWAAAVSANPFTSFFVVAKETGPLVLSWIEDGGETYTKEVTVNVAG